MSIRTVIERGPRCAEALQFLLRHCTFHVLDHAWEMEDQDLSEGAQ